jgi:hypothetical protein
VTSRKDEGPVLVQRTLFVEKPGQLLGPITRAKPAPELKMLATSDGGSGILLKESKMLDGLEDVPRRRCIQKLSHHGNLPCSSFGDYASRQPLSFNAPFGAAIRSTGSKMITGISRFYSGAVQRFRTARSRFGLVTDEQALDVVGRTITVTSPSKIFFPERGETKMDLVQYYLAVAEPFLRAAQGRPTLMQRFPNGAQGSSFFQKRVPKEIPEWLQTTTVTTPNGTTSRALAPGPRCQRP